MNPLSTLIKKKPVQEVFIGQNDRPSFLPLLKKMQQAFSLCFFLMLIMQNKGFAQDGLINDDFSTGNTFNWKAATSGSNGQLVNGQFVVTTALQSSGKYRGDLQKTGGITLHAGNYPIVAIKFTKPPRCNFFFDTNLGSYNNTNNNATKIALDDGNVYYWDLSTGKLGTTVLSQTQPTTLSLFQFKVADIEFSSTELAANDVSYEVSWVKTFQSVDELRAFVNPTGVTPPVFEYTGTFTHPGLLHNTTDLARIKDLVTRQVGRPYQSYQLLLQSNKSSATYAKAGPFKYLTRDASLSIESPSGMVSGGAVKNGVESDFLAAYYNALMWNITGDEAHAQKAVEILDAYSSYTVGIIGADAELNGLYGFMLANAAELMRYTYPAWSQANVLQCETMLKNVFYPTLQNFRPCAHGNWDIICMKALMAIAIFSNDNAMYNKVVNYFYYGEGNGSIGNYVLTDAGQLQESNRDQAHTMLAIGSLAELSEMAWKQGVDLYSANNNAILRGYEYTAKYNLGYDVPYKTSYDFCEKNYQDYTPEAISPTARGQFRAVFEIAYNHYVYRKNLKMPYTLEALATKIGPEGAPFGADNPGYGSLFFYLNSQADYEFNGGTTVDPSVGLIDDNYTSGADGWVAATSGSTASVADGQLTVKLALQSNGKYRGDMKKSAGATLYPPNYPILAIKMKKPSVVNLTFDTNLGAYGNGSNKWTGKVGDDIYYYDLTKGFGSGPTFLSTTAPTVLSTFQFKVADVPAGAETSYSVDWVKTVKSVNDLLAFDPNTGLINDNFNTTTDGWSANTSGATVASENGQLKVTLAQSNGKGRGDVKRNNGATLYPANYPIVAIKLKKPQVVNITFDTNLGSFGNGSNKFTGKVGDDIFYFDMTKAGFGSGGTMLTAPTALTLFQFKVADITSGEQNYLIDWVKTVKSVEELQNFVAPRYQTITFPALQDRQIGDADVDAGALASSGLTVSYTSSNESVATIVNGKVHIVGAGTTELTASQSGNADYYLADAVKQTLTVYKPFYVDADGDGFGSNVSTDMKLFATEQTPEGYADNNTDCDDTKLLYADNDGDGLGAGDPVACGVDNNSDCDDTNPIQLTAVIPDVYALNPAVDAKNTLYLGYGPSSLTISAQPAGGTSPYTFLWNTNETTPSISVSEAGSYSVAIRDVKGCSTSASIEISVVDVRCGNNNDKVMICHNGNAICVASASVQDHLNHGDQLGSCGTVTAAGSGSVVEEAATKAVVLYPNPVSEKLTISLGKLQAGATLMVYNASGAIIINQRLTNSTQTFSVKTWTAGIYYVKIINGGKTTTEKIVKQ